MANQEAKNVILFGPRGDPVSKRQEEPIFMEFGTTGLKRQSGVVREEFLRELQGSRGVKIFREMAENSAIVGSGLALITSLIRHVSWSEDPASKSAEDLQASEFLKSCLEDMSITFEDWLSETIRGMAVFGWTWDEIVYKRRVGESQGMMTNAYL